MPTDREDYKAPGGLFAANILADWNTPTHASGSGFFLEGSAISAKELRSGLRRKEKFPCGNFGTKVERRRRSRVVYCWKKMVPEAGVEPARF